MALNNTERNLLHSKLNEVIGVDNADTLMTYLPFDEPRRLATSAEVQKLDGDLTQFRAEMDQFRKDVDNRFVLVQAHAELHGERLRTELKTDIANVRDDINGIKVGQAISHGEMTGAIGELRGDIGLLDGKITSEVNRALRRQLLTMLAVVIALVAQFVQLTHLG